MREIPSREQVLSLDGAELTYWTAGSGPCVLLANGLFRSEAVWRPLLGHFADRYQLVWWRYRGLTPERFRDGEPAAPERHARDALAILEAEGVPQAAVLGWSMGVQVALELYRAKPTQVAALALVAGGARVAWGKRPEATFPGSHVPALLRLLRRLPEGALTQGTRFMAFPEALAWARRMGLVGANVDAELMAGVLREYARMNPRASLEMARVFETHDASDLLPRIKVPTLAVAAGRDPITSRAAVEHLVTRVPGAEYLVLAAATHFVLLDHADHLHLRLDKFFYEHQYV